MNGWGEAFRTIFRSWRRYCLTVIGIAIGIASVVTVRGLGNFGTAGVLSELNNLGRGGILLSLEDENGVSVLDDACAKWMTGQYGVSQVMPVLTQYARTEVGENSTNMLLFGVNESVSSVMALEFAEGESFSSQDILDRNCCCLIDTHTAEMLFGRTDIIGEWLPLKFANETVAVEVIGVVEAGSGLIQSTLEAVVPPMVYLPYTTLQAITETKTYQQLAIRLLPQEDINPILTEILQLLRELKPNATCTVRNLAQQVEHLNSLMDIVRRLLTAVAAISLLVACIGIVTNMMSVVRERRREIGIRKALGATKRQIVFSFLWESVLLSLIGGFFGSLFGEIALWTVGFVFQQWIPLDGLTVFAMNGISIIIGAVFGVLPAIRAGSVMPMEAIRQSDAP